MRRGKEWFWVEDELDLDPKVDNFWAQNICNDFLPTVGENIAAETQNMKTDIDKMGHKKANDNIDDYSKNLESAMDA